MNLIVYSIDCQKKTNKCYALYYDGMEGEGYIRGYLDVYPVNLRDNALRMDITSHKFFKIN